MTWWVVPVAHPVWIVRGAWAQEPLQMEWLRRARELAEGRLAPPELSSLVASGTPQPSIEQLAEWVAETERLGCPVAVDIECAGSVLRCVGVSRVHPVPAPTIFHFRTMGGQPAWSEQDTAKVVAILWDVLAGPIPLWFHNGQAFDVPYLQRLGFVVNNYAGDTMLMQRYLYPEAPADLQSVANFYCKMPAWKHLAHNEDDGDAK